MSLPLVLSSNSDASLKVVTRKTQEPLARLFSNLCSRRSIIFGLIILLWSLAVVFFQRSLRKPFPGSVKEKHRHRHSKHSENADSDIKGELVERTGGSRKSVDEVKSKRRKSRKYKFVEKLPSMYVLLGIPGSGKTHWANEYVQKVKSTAVILSSDDIRVELTGTARNRSQEEEVRRILLDRVRALIEEHKTFIVDDAEHNIDPTFRLLLLNAVHDHEYNAIIRKFSVKPYFADNRIQRDVAEGKERFIPSYPQLEALYDAYCVATEAVQDEEWYMEKQ